MSGNWTGHCTDAFAVCSWPIPDVDKRVPVSFDPLLSRRSAQFSTWSARLAPWITDTRRWITIRQPRTRRCTANGIVNAASFALTSRNWLALMRSQCRSCDGRGRNSSGRNQLWDVFHDFFSARASLVPSQVTNAYCRALFPRCFIPVLPGLLRRSTSLHNNRLPGDLSGCAI